jgi:hypothetical protein
MAHTGNHAQNVANSAQATPPHRYCPRSLSVHSRRRFGRRRRAEYLGQLVGTPTPWQVAAIESLVRREWLALLAERSEDLDTALRADREYQKLLDAYRRSLEPAATKPADPMAAVHEALAAAQRARQAGEAAA